MNRKYKNNHSISLQYSTRGQSDVSIKTICSILARRDHPCFVVFQALRKCRHVNRTTVQVARFSGRRKILSYLEDLTFAEECLATTSDFVLLLPLPDHLVDGGAEELLVLFSQQIREQSLSEGVDVVFATPFAGFTDCLSDFIPEAALTVLGIFSNTSHSCLSLTS